MKMRVSPTGINSKEVAARTAEDLPCRHPVHVRLLSSPATLAVAGSLTITVCSDVDLLYNISGELDYKHIEILPNTYMPHVP